MQIFMQFRLLANKIGLGGEYYRHNINHWQIQGGGGAQRARALPIFVKYSSPSQQYPSQQHAHFSCMHIVLLCGSSHQ